MIADFDPRLLTHRGSNALHSPRGWQVGR